MSVRTVLGKDRFESLCILHSHDTDYCGNIFEEQPVHCPKHVSFTFSSRENVEIFQRNDSKRTLRWELTHENIQQQHQKQPKKQNDTKQQALELMQYPCYCNHTKDLSKNKMTLARLTNKRGKKIIATYMKNDHIHEQRKSHDFSYSIMHIAPTASQPPHFTACTGKQ